MSLNNSSKICCTTDKSPFKKELLESISDIENSIKLSDENIEKTQIEINELNNKIKIFSIFILNSQHALIALLPYLKLLFQVAEWRQSFSYDLSILEKQKIIRIIDFVYSFLKRAITALSGFSRWGGDSFYNKCI